ncbi:MAG TPA: SsrA-binding protein SmpB [Limnobacter sp.]|uniref:SsrA-binding protein SmpB n=1 Tax=Limnobacter sp. TaxID=2003368 RepID=UPI002E354DBF|nr:SsrA-binding protein SmpB [Limnobacter sp.]HEX5485321.1 SsrA-binding protein SmpB [Limnobacter sp.]
MSLIQNKKASFDYFIEETYEAGMVLDGWEVKSIRAGKVQIRESHVVIKDGELYLLNAHISPLISASTHVRPDSTRTRKLLMHKMQINRLIGKVEQKGYALVPLNLHFKNGRVKCDIALAKGKMLHDKRDTLKDKDWKREQERLMKVHRT